MKKDIFFGTAGLGVGLLVGAALAWGELKQVTTEYRAPLISFSAETGLGPMEKMKYGLERWVDQELGVACYRYYNPADRHLNLASMSCVRFK